MKILFIDCTKKKNVALDDVNKVLKDLSGINGIDFSINYIECDTPIKDDFLSAEFFLDKTENQNITIASYLKPEFLTEQLKKVKREDIASLVCFIIDPVKNMNLVNITFTLYNQFGVCPTVCINDKNLRHYIRHETIHAIIALLKRNSKYSKFIVDLQDKWQKQEGVYGVINQRAKEIELQNLSNKMVFFSDLPRENKIWDKIFTLNHTLVNLLKQLVEMITLKIKRTQNQVIEIMAEAHARFEGYYIEGTLAQRLNNPGVLVYAGQRNASKHESGFCQFIYEGDGWEALRNQLKLVLDNRSAFYNTDMTIQEYIDVYASTSPKYERINYAKFLADRLNVEITAKLKELW